MRTLLRAYGTTWRERFRRAPAIGWVAIIAFVQLCATPFDELWHRLFGRDVTAFSPPHLLLAVGFTAVYLAIASLLITSRLRGYRSGLLVTVAISLALVQMMLLEHELPGIGADHPSQQRWPPQPGC